MPEEKVICETPTPGKKPTCILKWKYEAVRRAILKVVPKKGEGLLFKELSNRVEDALSRNEKDRLGSIGWYTTCVKLDMEVKGELTRVAGAKPQRLLRAP